MVGFRGIECRSERHKQGSEVFGPGVSPGVERFDTTSSVDVFSTILGATGTEAPGAYSQGRDLLAVGGAEAPAEESAEKSTEETS